MELVWALVERTPGARERVDARLNLKRHEVDAEKHQVLAHVLRVGGHDVRTVREVYELAPGPAFMVCVQLCLREWCAEVREAVSRRDREYATSLASLAIRACD
jgi:hypothetical protein